MTKGIINHGLPVFLMNHYDGEISAGRFLGLKSIPDLAGLLRISAGMLIFTSLHPVYKTFRIPKKAGGHRLIEAPEKQLKSRQRTLAAYLQAVYRNIKPASSQGFIRRYDDGYGTCNIISNAARHSGKHFVMNIDLEDFFHAITAGRVRNIFMAPPFSFNRQLSSLLAIMTTYYNRLPMGAPTSPVLSNLACLGMDKRMEELASGNHRDYTRYADDLYFSGDLPFRKAEIQNIRHIISENGFLINRDKFRIQPCSNRQTVTGLTVNEKVNLNRKYYRRLRAVLHDWQMNGIEETTRKYFKLASEPDYAQTWKFEQSLAGKINYLGMVRGRSDPLVRKLRDRFVSIRADSCQYHSG